MEGDGGEMRKGECMRECVCEFIFQNCIHIKYTNKTSTNSYFVIQFQVNNRALWL